MVTKYLETAQTCSEINGLVMVINERPLKCLTRSLCTVMKEVIVTSDHRNVMIIMHRLPSAHWAGVEASRGERASTHAAAVQPPRRMPGWRWIRLLACFVAALARLERQSLDLDQQ